MTDEPVAAFLAGERPDDVALYLSEDAVSSVGALMGRDDATPAGDGVVLVVPGERGRGVLRRLTGQDAMSFAGEAMGSEGTVAPTLADGTCPDAAANADEDETAPADADHAVRFTFSFVEAQNEDVGGIYAAGPVVHAYVQCACGTTYSDRWVAGER